MLVVLSPIFVADTKIIFGYNFVAPLNLFLNLLIQFKSIFRNELQKTSSYFVSILSLLALRTVEIYYNLIQRNHWTWT